VHRRYQYAFLGDLVEPYKPDGLNKEWIMDRITISGNGSPGLSSGAARKTDKGFAHRLKKAVEEVNRLQFSSDDAIQQVTKGSMGIHEGMIAIGKADISLRLLLQVRNKVVDAYREISRMAF
jgi:flagellar hook-basal body complex protein FliE